MKNFDIELCWMQKKFCKIYLASERRNGTLAAIEAGYSPHTARGQAARLLAKEHIQKYLRSEMEEIEKKLDLKIEKKAELLWKTAQRCYGPTDGQIEKINNGEELSERIFEFQPSPLVSAVAELNKMQGHYAVVKNVNSEDADKTAVVEMPANRRDDVVNDNENIK
jgi:phage terminase small subunit